MGVFGYLWALGACYFFDKDGVFTVVSLIFHRGKAFFCPYVGSFGDHFVAFRLSTLLGTGFAPDAHFGAARLSFLFTYGDFVDAVRMYAAKVRSAWIHCAALLCTRLNRAAGRVLFVSTNSL